MNGDVAREQFIYPKSPKLRKAYQGIVCKVLAERRVIFQPVDLILTIMDYLGWEDDSNLEVPDKKPGPKYRQAKDILKSFSGKFVKSQGFLGDEVFIFKTDRKRVRNFAELEELCRLDPDMSELTNVGEDHLDMSQPWEDNTVSHPAYPISSELAKIDAGIEKKKAAIEAQAQKHSIHSGTYKGSVLDEKDILDAVAAGRRGTTLSATQKDRSSEQPIVTRDDGEETKPFEVISDT